MRTRSLVRGEAPPSINLFLADKIACIGPSSARHIASWGNAAKVEVTGMPRLDYLLMRPGPVRNRPGSRILVMTAKRPGFTEEQTATTVRSLQDVKNHLDTLRGVDVVLGDLRKISRSNLAWRISCSR